MGGPTVIPVPTPARSSAVWTTDLRKRLDELLDEYRASLHDSLDGLTEDEARLRLVPSKTTLLGLLKHVTYVEGVWFEQAISGRSYADIGIPSTPDRSFTLDDADTIASVQEAHRSRCEVSRRTMARLTLDVIVDGRGDRSVWSLLLQVLRELAHHAGHADILPRTDLGQTRLTTSPGQCATVLRRVRASMVTAARSTSAVTM